MDSAIAEAERQARIVRFWRAVEYFSPQQVDSPKKAPKEVERVFTGQLLPWEREAKPIFPGFVWRHTVYAGVFDIEKIRDVLQTALPTPEPDPDHAGRINGQSALLSLTLDDTGRLYRESVTVSSCAWALGRTVLPPGPGSSEWLDGFDDCSKDIRATLFEIGDGRVRIEASGNPESGGKRVLRAIAGVSARVALDMATGGLASLAGIVGTAVTEHFGEVAGKVAEKMSDALAKDATSAIEKRAKKTENDEEPSAENAADQESTPKNLGTKALTVEDLSAITRWVAEALGVDDVLEPTEIWVKSFRVSAKHADEMSGDEIINSFYAKDLEKVATEILDRNAGRALTAYLRSDESINADGRIDVRQQPHEMLKAVSPEAMPLGRWPAKPEHPLNLSQQFAVNQILATLGDPEARGIYAVNGPPGTGKTTMLRDLIAAVIVKRAERLADLPNPRAAFASSSSTVEWTCVESGHTRRITPLIAELTGFEMVVASSNNGAVENITMEVPALDSVDRQTFPDAEYFSGPATMLAGEPCWGAVAARLGNRNNRSEFVKRFWWGNIDRGGPQSANTELTGLSPILRDLAQQGMQPDPDLFARAVQTFRNAVATVRRLAAERQRVAEIAERAVTEDPYLRTLRRQARNHVEQIQRLQAMRADLSSTETSAISAKNRAEQAVSTAVQALEAADAAARAALARLGDAERAMYAHAGTKPGWLKRLLSGGTAMPDWEDAAGPFLAEVTDARRSADAAQALCGSYETEWHKRQHEYSTAAAAVNDCRQRLDRCDQAIQQAQTNARSTVHSVRQRQFEIQQEAALLEQARELWDGAVPGDEWNPLGVEATADDQRNAMEKRERSAPWMDKEFAEARSRVFLAALALHHAVLTAEPKLAWDNLRAAVDVVKGAAPVELPPHKARAAWQMLFFAVPVVSTTFASVPTMFNALGREDLGWLFIDEAGQATPQAAVGALWRSRRAVVVGDPRQLEPVVTLPWQGQQRLYAKFGLTKRWTPQFASVQSIADRVNAYGTWLPEPDTSERIWVGSPLRVHRRCDPLMFEVSNTIAYDNMMVYGVTGRDEPFPLGDRNLWVQVDARTSGGKWNPEEGRLALTILRRVHSRIEAIVDEELRREGTDHHSTPRDRDAEIAARFAESIFIVSPFRAVATALDRYLRREGMPIPRDRLGTVHTTQGKEADIVILVLGTATHENRAREWASGTPNLLNVAVTRARRRLVVIGDFHRWGSLQNFSALAEHAKPGGLLEHWTPAPTRE
ncbi:DEAD/DEAH box helicase [Nocardia terrae]|nr:ATP-binding protein [Nocardia terrae]